MKKANQLTVRHWTLDNAGTYHRPGAVLTIDDDGSDGCIDAARADAIAQMMAGHDAAAPAAAADEAASEPPVSE